MNRPNEKRRGLVGVVALGLRFAATVRAGGPTPAAIDAVGLTG
jgi:hypothetical protein